MAIGLPLHNGIKQGNKWPKFNYPFHVIVVLLFRRRRPSSVHA